MKMDVLTASAHIINKVHAYMREHPESELHRQGKMFGVLVYRNEEQNSEGYLAAFSAKLDGSYHHEGFVPPVYEITTPPVGTDKAESQRLQRLLFANYRFLNSKGETANLLDIFQNEKNILSPEDFFNPSKSSRLQSPIPLPPSGAGECCAPKLLQYAFTHGLRPVAMTEFWVGAPSRTEVRQEGSFYPPCAGRCVPILKHMLKGIEMTIYPKDATPSKKSGNPIEVIYEDDYLMVVNKPAGLLSVPGKSGTPSLTELLSMQCGTPVLPVHRLDQDTSGLLVLAKNAGIYKTLQAYFQRRDVFKRYEALISGEGVRDLPDEGLIELPLLPDPYDRPRQMVNHEHGKVAITRYTIRERRPDGRALVDFYPQTGRTHQLRVHAAHPDGMNAPIIGDRLYGGLPAQRLMLHAAEIVFQHPVYLSVCSFCASSSSSSW